MKISGHVKDLTGQKFGRLLVIEPVGQNDHGAVMWKAKCDCTKETIVHRFELRRAADISKTLEKYASTIEEIKQCLS